MPSASDHQGSWPRRRRVLSGIVLLLVGAPALLILMTAREYPRGVARAPLSPAPTGRLAASIETPAVDGPHVVVMLFDGFAPAMIERTPTPALDRMRLEGAWTHHLVPVFPTLSMTNGFTLTTGCWPDRHGVPANRFLDPDRGLFDHGRDADWVVGCELLHEVAERQGVRTASLGWYGATSTRRGRLASEVDFPSFGDYPEDSDRAREIVRLLGLPEGERPRLILAYFKGPDSVAHREGLDAPEVAAIVRGVDAAVGSVMEAIETLRLEDRITLVVTTDHGMRPANRLVNVERILKRNEIRATTLASGSVALVYLDDASESERTIERLRRYEQLEVIHRDDQPHWCRLGTGTRVAEIIVSARPPYFIEDRGRWPRWARWLAFIGPEFVNADVLLRATHGYPPDDPGVHGLLYAWGRDVEPGLELPRIDAVDVHPTLAVLLEIEPGSPVDGAAVPLGTTSSDRERNADTAFARSSLRGTSSSPPRSAPPEG